MLGVNFNNKLTFEKHITDICGKASRRIYAPARNLSKQRMVIKAFFQFAVELLPTDLDVSQSHNK